jgi:hypothetical protein
VTNRPGGQRRVVELLNLESLTQQSHVVPRELECEERSLITQACDSPSARWVELMQ